jgi:hypothetical protein
MLIPLPCSSEQQTRLEAGSSGAPLMRQSTPVSVPTSARMHFDLFLRGADVLFIYMRTSVELENPVL